MMWAAVVIAGVCCYSSESHPDRNITFCIFFLEKAILSLLDHFLSLHPLCYSAPTLFPQILEKLVAIEAHSA